MTEYLVFWSDSSFEQGYLEEHLKYLRDWGGTPDMWDSFNDLREAILAADKMFDAYVVTDDSYNIIYERKKDDTENKETS